jgi:hypothetical protein
MTEVVSKSGCLGHIWVQPANSPSLGWLVFDEFLRHSPG